MTTFNKQNLHRQVYYHIFETLVSLFLNTWELELSDNMFWEQFTETSIGRFNPIYYPSSSAEILLLDFEIKRSRNASLTIRNILVKL